MRKYILMISAVISLGSCIKQYEPEPEPYVDPCTTGTIQLINTSDNPYDVFIDGKGIGQQPGNTTWEKTYDKGYHAIKVQQASGYILYPTIKEGSVTLDGCDKKVITYP